MGITLDEWYKRLASRSDLTGRVTHLTRPKYLVGSYDGLSNREYFEAINAEAVDNLIKILVDKQINASSVDGYIMGPKKAVCFQDVPLYALSQNVEYERQRTIDHRYAKIRYCGVGLSFTKPIIYMDYSGRPVIYESKNVAKGILDKREWWRIVSYNFNYSDKGEPDIIDWTHEREWRVPGDLRFSDYSGIHIILYNPCCTQRFLSNCPKEILEGISGISTLTSIFM